MKLQHLRLALLPAFTVAALAVPLLSSAESLEKPRGDPKTLFRNYTKMAESYQARGVYPKAEEYYRLSFRAARRAYGENSAYSASALNRIGQVCFQQGHYVRASSCFRDALRIYGAGSEVPSSAAAVVLSNLAATEEELGKISASEESFRKAVDYFESKEPNYPSFGTTLTNYALLLVSTGELAEAKRVSHRGISLLEKQGPSIELAASYTTLARLDMLQSDYTPAESLLTRAYDCLYRIGGLYSPIAAAVLTQKARLYAATGRQMEALAAFQQAIQLYRHFVAPGHPALLAALRSYAKVLRLTKQKKEAKKVEALIARNSEQPAAGGGRADLVDVKTLRRENWH